MKAKKLEIMIFLIGFLILLSACRGGNSGEVADLSDQEVKYTEKELLEKCPPPQPGYVLVGVTYVIDAAARDIYGEPMPGVGGYAGAEPLPDDWGEGGDIEAKLVCVYSPIKDPYGGQTPLSCPPAQEGYYLAGWTLYSNTFGPTMEEDAHSGKQSPSEGGYVHTDSGQGLREDGSPIDYVLVCIYEPYKTIEGISIDLSCPLDPGHVPIGFTYKKDGNVVVAWGEQETGPRVKIFADEGTYEADGETHKEEKCCTSTSVEDLVPAQMPEDEGAETSEPPSEECTQYDPYEVACEAPEEEGECVYSPPDDLFQPSDTPVCVDPSPDGEPCCNEWEGAECLPLGNYPGSVCVLAENTDSPTCPDCNQPASCEATYNVLLVTEGAACDSDDLAWLLVDDGDGDYFGAGDVGFDHTGGAFYYVAPYDFEYYASDTVVGSVCKDGRLITEMVINVYELAEYFQNGKVTYVVGYENAGTGATYISPAMEFDLCKDLQD